MGINIQSRLGFNDTFYTVSLESAHKQADFVVCPECNGLGYKLGGGKNTQRHICRKCNNIQRYHPCVPKGYIPDPAFNNWGEQPVFVMVVTMRSVWRLVVEDGSNGVPQISYVYDSGYEGDFSVPESEAHEDIDQAIAAGHQQLKDHAHFYTHQGPLRGVMFQHQSDAYG